MNTPAGKATWPPSGAPRVRRVWPFMVSVREGATTVTLPPKQPKPVVPTLPDALF